MVDCLFASIHWLVVCFHKLIGCLLSTAVGWLVVTSVQLLVDCLFTFNSYKLIGCLLSSTRWLVSSLWMSLSLHQTTWTFDYIWEMSSFAQDSIMWLRWATRRASVNIETFIEWSKFSSIQWKILMVPCKCMVLPLIWFVYLRPMLFHLN